MRTPLTLVVAAALAPPGAAQAGAPARRPEVDALRPAVTAILDEALARGRAYAKLAELVEVAPHRLSGSPGLAAAIEWARRAMVDDGLENVRLEPCTVPRWERGDVERLRVVAPASAAETPLPVLALGGSVATPEGGLEAGVVRVAGRAEYDALGDTARGKIVFFDEPFDATLPVTFRAYGKAVWQRTEGAVLAAEAGGVAAIVRSMSSRSDDFPHTGAMRYADGVRRVPAAAVSTLGADRLAKLLERSPDLRLSLELDCRDLGEAPSFNVVGELVGRERPEEVVVLGGHLDAWDVGQGAHDDGGPCCQTLEALRILRSLGLRPRRTLRVVLFTNEENGLAGARAYYAAHEQEMERHVMALESDAGAFTPRGFRTDANPEAAALLAEICTFFAPYGAQQVSSGGGGADIGPMRRAGVVLVGYEPDSQRYFDLHHSARDTLAEVSPRELELGAGLIAALCYAVAELQEPLPRNPLPDAPSSR